LKDKLEEARQMGENWKKATERVNFDILSSYEDIIEKLGANPWDDLAGASSDSLHDQIRASFALDRIMEDLMAKFDSRKYPIARSNNSSLLSEFHSSLVIAYMKKLSEGAALKNLRLNYVISPNNTEEVVFWLSTRRTNK
jgi:hypothetical protein